MILFLSGNLERADVIVPHIPLPFITRHRQTESVAIDGTSVDLENSHVFFIPIDKYIQALSPLLDNEHKVVPTS